MIPSPSKLLKSFRRLVSPADGQDLIEYSLLIALVAGTVLLTLQGLGVKVSNLYSTTSEAMPDNAEPGAPGHGNPGNGNPGNGKPVGSPGNGNPGSGNPGNGNPGGNSN